MDQKEIESIVRAVLGQIGGTAAPAPASTSSAAAAPAGADGGCLPDLGDASVKNWIGVRNPKSLEVLQELKRNSGSRVCSGRVGTRPRTPGSVRILVWSRSSTMVHIHFTSWVRRVVARSPLRSITSRCWRILSQMSAMPSRVSAE